MTHFSAAFCFIVRSDLVLMRDPQDALEEEYTQGENVYLTEEKYLEEKKKLEYERTHDDEN
eukprot:177194-Rhodomonas_salina.1